MGSIGFFVLDGQASSTPPLIGSRTLCSKRALISYLNSMFLFRDDEKAPHEELPVFAIQMQALKSGHLTLDFSEKPHAMKLDFRGATPAWMIDESTQQNAFEAPTVLQIEGTENAEDIPGRWDHIRTW